jgi:protein SCO1/2
MKLSPGYDRCRMTPLLSRWRRVSGCFALVVLLSLLLSCKSSSTSSQNKRYHFTGKVVSVDKPTSSAMINNDTIPGYMEPMSMNYKVKPESVIDQLAAGQTIAGELVVRNGDYWLENVAVTAQPAPGPKQGSSLYHIPQPGELVPDFELVNQDAKSIAFSQFHGQILLLTFVYTRCPFADFCPRVSGEFAKLQQKLHADSKLARETHLLTVSFDPKNDTPAVLRNYGFSTAKTKDPALFQQWDFAVPKKEDLPRLANFFALTYLEEGPVITHSLSTAVIRPDGKIYKWYHGSDWTADDLLKDVNAVAQHNSV